MARLSAMCSRRAVLHALAVAAIGWPRRSAAERARRVAVILFGAPATDANLRAFLAELRALGHVDGGDVALEYHAAEGRPERLRQLAADAAATKPDIILAMGGDVAPFARQATRTIPIVMVVSTDPMEAGLVTSLARPGGNLTGLSFVSSETAGKRLQLLKEALPAIAHVALLWNPEHPDGEYRNTVAAGRALGIRVDSLEVRRPEELDAALDAAVGARVDALIVASSRLMTLNRARILDFAARRRLPLVGGWGPWAGAGGLMSYGPDLDAVARRAAAYVDKILKGTPAGDLPVEQPSRFELVVNLKTAETLGLAMPPSVLLRADRVIR